MSRSSNKLRAVILAFVMVFSVFAGTVALTGTVAADNAAINNGALSPQSIASGGSDKTQELTTGTGTNLEITNDANDADHSFRIDISSLPDGVVNSDTTLTVDTSDIDNVDTLNIKDVDAENELILLSVKTSSNNNIIFNDGALQLEGLDTTGTNTVTGLEYTVRVDEILDPEASGFNAEGIGTSDNFDLALVEVENLETGDQITTTSLSDAIVEAEDDGSGDDLGGNAGDNVEIRLSGGTYSISTTIDNPNLRIKPIDGQDVVIQNDADDAPSLDLTTQATDVIGIEIEDVTFDQTGNDDAALDVSTDTGLTVTGTNFTNIGGAAAVIVDNDADTLSIENSNLSSSNNNHIGVEITDETGNDDASISITGSVIENFATGVDINTGALVSSLTVENNRFVNNNFHVLADDQDSGSFDLDGFFNANSFDKFALIQQSDGDIDTDDASDEYAIYGDLTNVDDNADVFEASDNTVVISAGDHTIDSSITVDDDGTTIRGADGTTADEVDVDVSTPNALDLGTADDVTISGIDFAGANNIVVNADGVDGLVRLSITDNRFSDLGGGDVNVLDLSGTGGDALVDADISGNEFVSQAEAGTDYTAIEIAEVAEGTSPTTTSISENSITGTDRGGIVVTDVTNGNDVETALDITDNTVEVTDDEESAGVILTDAAADDPSGVVDTNVLRNEISAVDAAAANGIDIDADDSGADDPVTVEANTVTGFDDDPTATGIDTNDFSEADLTVADNDLTVNSIHIHFISGTQDVDALRSANDFTTLVELLEQEDGPVQKDRLYGTIGGASADVDANDDFVSITEGIYDESQIDTTNPATFSSAGNPSETVIRPADDNPIFSLDTDNIIDGLTFDSSEREGGSVDVDIDSDAAVTIQNSVFNGLDDRTAILADGDTVTIQGNDITGYDIGVDIDANNDASTSTDIVRNTITGNNVGIVVQDDSTDDANIQFNTIVGNNIGLQHDETDNDEVNARANWWGDPSGPSTEDDTFTGTGDEIAGNNLADLADPTGTSDNRISPWLSGPVSNLPTDQYVVVSDLRNPVSDSGSDAEVIAAVLTSDFSTPNTDSGSTRLIGDPAGPLTGLGSPDGGSAGTAADPFQYFGVESSTPRDFTLTARDLDGDVASGSGTQTFTGTVAGVRVTSEQNSLVADDSTTVNVTIQMTDGNGNAVSDPNRAVSFLIENGSAANVTRESQETQTDTNGEAVLEISAGTAGVNTTITGLDNLDGFSNTTFVETIEPAAANDTLELVDGPTTITQNESYSVTVNVINEGDGVGTQDITYNLEDSTGISQLSATEEDVQLDAGASQEVTFEVAASDTQSLSTGNFTHVISSDDDEITLDAEVVEETAEQSPLEGPAGRFDDNGDGDISITELGDAGTAFAQGELSVSELGEVGQEFAS